MTRYNTGNPLGSNDPRDLYDNAENLDAGINGPAETWVDRLGQTRKSWDGIEADFQQFLIDGSVMEFSSWTSANAASIPVNKQVQIIGDSGTHTDPVSGLTVPNSGRFVMTASGLQYRGPETVQLVSSQVAIPITVTSSSSSPNAITGTTANAISPAEGQLVSFRTAAAENSGAVTISLNGGPARSIVNQIGAALSAGQLAASSNYIARVTAAGTLMLTSAVEATEAQATAATNSTNMMTPRRAELVLAPVRINGRRSRYLVDGQVLRSWVIDANTRSVSLSQGRVWIENNGAAVAYSINPVVDQALSNRQAIMVDLDSAPDGSGRLTPYVGNPAASANSGWQTANRIVLYSLANQQSGADTLQIRGGGYYSGTGDRQAEMEDIQVTGSGGIFSVLTSGGINNARFVEWRFGNAASTAPNPNVVAGDVYRLIGVYDCLYSVDRVRTRVQQICRTAEFETAIRQNGAGDFVGGGSHGNQIKGVVKAFADGVQVNPASSINLRCRRFEVIQTSKLYRYGQLPDGSGNWLPSQELGTVHTHWVWENGKLTLDNTLVVTNPIVLDYTYLGIMPVYRRVAPAAGGADVDIVTEGWRDLPSQGVEDLSTSSYTDTYTQSSVMRGWGGGGYLLEMEKLSGWDKPGRDARFASTVDNKFYQNVTGMGYSANAGEVISVKTRYAITLP